MAHNYKDIVLDDKKDVLIEFYAPWCGHCKALAPKYEELGALYQSNADYASKVTIAKVDATANDVPDEIQGFPTIKLYKAGDKTNPVEYSGDRSIEDLIKFVKEKGKYGIDASAKTEAKVDDVLPDAEQIGKAAEAATEKLSDTIKSVASEATEVVKTMLKDDEVEDPHDEL